MAELYTSAAQAEIIDHAGPTAPWLALVHGMAQDSRVFDAQVKAFRDRFRILLIDLPGHGLSADLPGPFGQAEMAGAVVAALTALAKWRFIIGARIPARHWACCWRPVIPTGFAR
ncbi:MAG: hypothetical protein HOI19_04625 [Rhodospirillaceae bacterium]|nr:hypothetical protein [Rhodospirillaceae bacterium]